MNLDLECLRSSKGSRSHRLCLLVAFVLLARRPDVGVAQDRASAGATTAPPSFVISGTVRDSAGVALDSVEVSILEVSRRTYSRANGSFRFDSIAPGTYRLRARRLGFSPGVISVTITDSSVSVEVRLTRSLRALTPVVTSAIRGGLSGFVGDTGLHALQGSEVSSMGQHVMKTVTDSAGAFFLPLGTGKYMIAVTHSGFATRLVGLTIPRDSGRQVQIFLQPPTRAVAPTEAWNLVDLRKRLTWRSNLGSKLYTAEDMHAIGDHWVSDVIRRAWTQLGLKRIPDEGCSVVVNGGPSIAMADTLSTDDVETVEVYDSSSALAFMTGSSTLRRRRSNVTIRNTEHAVFANVGLVCPITYVWLR
jgi:hypothetical protein